jgi:hypothetical protein
MANSGGVYVYNYYSYCSCYRVTGAAIRVANNTVIGTTCNTAVGTASEISRGFYKVYYRVYYKA